MRTQQRIRKQWNAKTKAGAVSALAAVIMIIVLMLTACQSGGAESSEADMTGTGTLINGVYRSKDGRFTAEADGKRWKPADGGEIQELCFMEDMSVRITFSPAQGLDGEMVEDFEDSFADSYVEALEGEYPDIRREDIRKVSQELAGLGMTMTDSSGGYRMYQFLYLASDGENGYLITAAFPEEKENVLKQEVMQIIESFQFTEING